jgi:hypothetical protein
MSPNGRTDVRPFVFWREQLTALTLVFIEGPLSGAFWSLQCYTEQIFSKRKSMDVNTSPRTLRTKMIGNFGSSWRNVGKDYWKGDTPTLLLLKG